ncbi:MAG: hypothetical protein C0469_14445 [Cyanobacteria bacterium DS2.3.42]|nr:hypothetical protein [Cyanobacteria bacterium DS2.3.42]
MLLSQISVAGTLQLLGVLIVSMLIGAGAMMLRNLSVRNRLRRFHRVYGQGYMTPNVDALLANSYPITQANRNAASAARLGCGAAIPGATKGALDPQRKGTK